MAKRLLDCTSSDIAGMTGKELAEAIAGSEGRVLVCETIGAVQPMLGDVTNAEFAAAMGADMLILNLFDVNHPVINGLPDTAPEDTIREVKRLTGRAVGINLEPLEEGIESTVDTNSECKLTSGRAGTLENAERAVAMGVDFIVLTGNPGVGVTNQAIVRTLREYRERFGDQILLIAGKMHAAGILSESGENIITEEDVRAFAEAGADVILMPAPGTVPGITTEYIRGLVSCAHSLGKLTLTAIGTSQEGADASAIREIALMCKMTGTDLHHLGDSGYVGMALPENILEYGKVIRGVRHTYHRMASSINR
ncbi:MAG TPA: haloacid dehalogenase-like hydrolase [Candidatus Mediterraneibacter faecigallinarum]|uniref:Haloacid dehalogenase-like hydrolase n=1 Tax=Candidatus Mediterraneibacter faecigallinarum TaxID=2838669 RepID=A0A9D2NSK3_9FIRM|nr:haloacid dehalogenase-like hydrolase [Candidatus Mediterraneibacter faecigallinarum]